jgi:phosphosulfolactate phosphohydrolase-like enzyme
MVILYGTNGTPRDEEYHSGGVLLAFLKSLEITTMTALYRSAQKDLISRGEAIDIAMETYIDYTLAEDIVERLENDERVADIREEIERSLLQEKTEELEHMSNEDLLLETGLVDDCEICSDRVGGVA